MSIGDLEPIPVSALEHYSYCPAPVRAHSS